MTYPANDNAATAGCAIYQGDCLEIFCSIPSASVDFGGVDPPYFIDGMGADWSKDNLEERTARAGAVGGLPTSMKFDRQQGAEFAALMEVVSKEMFRILKPGSFFVAFSQARLYHNLATAVEGAGFEVRDMMGWTYEGQAKAFSQDHFVRKMKNLTEAQQDRLIALLGGRKTPQLKPMIEPMVLAQKPREGTFVENWQKHGVGLIDTTASLDGKFPGNLMAVAKPTKAEKGAANDHLTVKPLALMEHLIKLFTKPGDTVIDPCAGSGTTGLAALNMGRNAVLIEREAAYCDIIRNRLHGADLKKAA